MSVPGVKMSPLTSHPGVKIADVTTVEPCLHRSVGKDTGLQASWESSPMKLVFVVSVEPGREALCSEMRPEQRVAPLESTGVVGLSHSLHEETNDYSLSCLPLSS